MIGEILSDSSRQPIAPARTTEPRWRRTGEVPRTLEELRACLWYEQRRWRFLGREPDTEGMRYAGALIGAMRHCL